MCHHPLVQHLTRRIEQDLARRAILGGASGVTEAYVSPEGSSRARSTRSSGDLLQLKNLRLFDGFSPVTRAGVTVVVQGNKIISLETEEREIEGATVIDCGGRTLMPGLIDVHWHSTFAAIDERVAHSADIGYLHLVAAREAERTLLRGFTSVRDIGGPSFALKRAIDEGMILGPRIFPSGAMISQTGGHGDFRMRHEVPRGGASQLSQSEIVGAGIIADGVPEVLRHTREQLMLGASQIKLMAGGGVTSLYDPLDGLQYSEAEIRAAVEAAADWDTYVAVHVYVPKGIQRAIRAGVRCIEHGQLTDEETVELMAKEGVWWSLQPFLDDEDGHQFPDEKRQEDKRRVSRGTESSYQWAIKHGVNVGFGSDIIFSPGKNHLQNNHLGKLTLWYEPVDVVRMATSRNAELLNLSGRKIYGGVALGVIAIGAFADVLVVEGDPTVDIDPLKDPEANIRVVIKDGKIYKNTLPPVEPKN